MHYVHLGTFFPEWDGWILDRNGLNSPERGIYTPNQLHYYHWQGQILSVLRHHMNTPEQRDLFDDLHF